MSKLLSIDGLPVVDAKHPLVLTITERDIARANTKQADNCAAARACLRQMKVPARVHLSRVYIRTTKDHWTRFTTPAALRSEIIAFDRGGRFAPGDYTLAAIQPALRQGRKSRVHTETGRGKRKSAPYHTTADVRNGPAA